MTKSKAGGGKSGKGAKVVSRVGKSNVGANAVPLGAAAGGGDSLTVHGGVHLVYGRQVMKSYPVTEDQLESLFRMDKLAAACLALHRF